MHMCILVLIIRGAAYDVCMGKESERARERAGGRGGGQIAWNQMAFKNDASRVFFLRSLVCCGYLLSCGDVHANTDNKDNESLSHHEKYEK